jgi:HKD family nuclease
MQPNRDRIDYGSLLMPPEGFRLENAIATSYSLDLDALVSIPVALYFAHSLDLDISKDMVQVLDSIRRASETVKVFCQKGQIKVPDNQHRLYSFIESCIVQMSPTHSNSFHPKTWTIRYSNDVGDIKYKLIVLSRNLTFDRSWDLAFQLDGDCAQDRKNNFSETKPLVDFISYLTDGEKIPWIKDFLTDLAKTKFNLNSNEFEEFTFLPSGIPGYQKNIIFDGHLYDDLLIISPFLTTSGLELAAKHSIAKPKLFSRTLELRRINKNVLRGFSSWHLSKDYVEGEEKIETETSENRSVQEQDLHAKLYSYKDGWDGYLLVGSANCSERAMLRNVEFMLNLKGKNSKVGPDVIFKELVNDDLKVFEKFDMEHENLSDAEELLIEQDRILQALKIDIVNSTLRAKAHKQEDSNYRIDLSFDLKAVKTDHSLQVTAYLFRADNQKQKLVHSAINEWSVHNITELDISSFLIIELGIDHIPLNLKFAIKIKIENLPGSRNTKIFRDIISNTANFFKYIRFLLTENYWDEELGFNENSKGSGHGLPFYISQEEPIYENMLKAISRDRQKIGEIKSVIEKISEEDDDFNPIIPSDFKQLWSIFEQVIKKNDK